MLKGGKSARLSFEPDRTTPLQLFWVLNLLEGRAGPNPLSLEAETGV